MSKRKICCLVLLVLGLLAIAVSVIVILALPKCAPGSYLHAAVAADTEICSDIGRDILQRKGSAVDATIAALVCTSVLNPQSMGLGGGVIFTIYNATTGEVVVINARETAPENIKQDLLDQCTSSLQVDGSLMLSDLKNFKAKVMTPLNISLGGYTMYSPPAPAGGAVLLFILNVLKEFKFTPQSLTSTDGKIETYHRIAEALKFGNGQKPKSDDPQFSGIEQVIFQELLSNSFAELVKNRIDDRGDHPDNFYNLSQPSIIGSGTSHISVLAEDGSAVSVTSTINQPFGSMVYSPKTGIILNNELVDFCKKKPRNKITSGEIPPSAMVPSILISKDDNSKLVIGGSGGDLIISATALAIMNKLWFGYDLEHAISLPVLHASTNNSIQFEPKFDEDVKLGLLNRGHRESKPLLFLNVVQGISKEGRCIFSYSDQRKMGKSSGY
ncbi:glutathione hydrolase 5 proenzyme isoform X3 [Caretta caretta]|uniref:glutathione hydrolase 5 proenzyme isoform X3 n=1 Tax=Caretta caretta TaxID=8467 RepID=UPI003F4CA82B